jgi:toxin-antitoxin system PIN domain toxin
LIAPDTNLLVLAHNLRNPLYERASAYWQDTLNGDEPVGIPILSLHGFIRVSTGPAYLDRQLTVSEAVAVANSWLVLPKTRLLMPGPRHWLILEQLAIRFNARRNRFTDLAIAAIAIEHGAVIHTHDTDFATFPGIQWHDPLA